MSSSIQLGTSGLGIQISSPETAAQSTGFGSHTASSKQGPVLGGCPTVLLGPTLASENQQRIVGHGFSSPMDDSDKCYESVSERPHTALGINDNERNRRGSDIDTVLGNAKSRLRYGARLLPQTPGEKKGIALEKAKQRARVDSDILLSNDICVEGGYLQGLIKLRIRKHLKKSQSVLLSGGKVRIVGFESIAKEEERSTFYQFCVDLSDVASGVDALYCSEPDLHGFMKAVEGVHVLPFTLQLTSSRAQGAPKGIMHTQFGTSIRYIAMVSFRIKDAISGKMSIAHFYRDCSVWPRFNPSAVLSPTSRPIQITISEGVEAGGNGRVNLTVSLHRLHWVAGQRCHVRLDIVNNSKKTIKLLSLELFQTITTFEAKDTSGDEQSLDSTGDTLQSTKTQKQVAESTLTIGEKGTRGHASAKGWWMGVMAGSSQTFFHSILLPACALSISRGRLLEVSYTLRATISHGSFLSTDINASVPLEIINYLSIDPPPRLAAEAVANHSTTGEAQKTTSSTINYSYEGEVGNGSADSEDDNSSECHSDRLGNLSVHDDTDEVVDHVVSSAKIDGENAPRFADLYYSLEEEHLSNKRDVLLENSAGVISGEPSNLLNTTKHKELQKHPSSFPARVEEKMSMRKATLHEENQIIETLTEEKHAQTGLTIAEQILGGPQRDDSREPIDSSGNLPAKLSVSLSKTLVGDHHVDSIIVASATTSLSARLPAHHETRDTAPTEQGNLQVPLMDSPPTIGPREVSINDIINTYIEPSQPKINTLHARSPSQKIGQDIPNPDATMGSSRPRGERSKTINTTRHPSIEMLVTSRPRSKSVRDKIRELEELAAKTNGGL